MAVNFNLDLLYKLYRHDSLNGGTSGSIIDAENFNKNAFVINGNQITVKEATHTENGVVKFICSCGESYTEEIGKTTEHTYISKIKRRL